MNANAPSHSVYNRKYAPLLHGCAIALALVAVARAPLARGQAFQGTPTVTAGSASVNQVGTTDTITVFSDQVVIDWVPTDTSGAGTIDFLPSGSTGLFQDFISFPLANFTVLNRIQPVNASGVPVSLPIALNGTVQSRLASVQGGAVWFYSPGGIIAGPTSVFDVGGLLLTTNAIAVDPTNATGNYLFGASGQTSFAGPSGSTSSVTIQPGATISALAAGSYVALVAPRVVQGGTVTVNGSAAYVAAEAVDITINNGLFDIVFGTGTDDANGVVHTGTTNGPASTASTDTQRIFMAAMPKNSALTMLLTGNIGYTAAASVAQEGSAIVLSAGHDISGVISGGTSSSSAAANISIGNGTYSS
ncbi:MAG: histidine kinase, partial [Alphaproteobacteria bacterium]|nr:histidine kinase [Alphaproteobacteria bacterium]